MVSRVRSIFSGKKKGDNQNIDFDDRSQEFIFLYFLQEHKFLTNVRNKNSWARNVQEYWFLRRPGNYIPQEYIFRRELRHTGIKFREFLLPLRHRNFSSRNLTPELLFLAIIRNLYSWLGIVFLKNSGILIPEKNSSRKIYSQKKSLRKIIPGINLPEECWFLRNSRKTPSLWHL